MGRVWRWLEEGDPTATPKLWYKLSLIANT